MTLPTYDDVAAAAARIAPAAHRTPVLLNPAPAQRLFDALLARVDYLVVNETEAESLTGIAVGDDASAVRAADALRRLPERNRFFKGLASWIGYKQFRVDYEPAARVHGSTSWSPYALIGLSIEGLTSFSVAPLRLASMLGLTLAFIALLFGATWLVNSIVIGAILLVILLGNQLVRRGHTLSLPVAFGALLASLVVAWLVSSDSADVTGRVFEAEGGKISVADGWQHGTVIDNGARWDPRDIGPAVRELLASGPAPAPVYGAS